MESGHNSLLALAAGEHGPKSAYFQHPYKTLHNTQSSFAPHVLFWLSPFAQISSH